MGIDQALGMDGDKLACTFGAMDANQIGKLEGNQLFDAANRMSGEHLQFMDSESVQEMFGYMGIDRALNLEGRQLAGLFGAMDHEQLTHFGGQQLFDAANQMSGGISSSWAQTVPLLRWTPWASTKLWA